MDVSSVGVMPPWTVWLVHPWLTAGAVAASALLLVMRLERSRPRERHRRGAQLKPRRSGSAALRAGSHALSLGGVPIAAADETRHFKLIGTTGTGKSTAIAELLAGALRRGDRAVISDPDGAYLRRFWRHYRGDSILNPYEPGSMRWDLFGELQADYDSTELARALIASCADANAQEWRGYARTLLDALIRRCAQQGTRDAGVLWRLVTLAPDAQLRALLSGTAAQPFLEPDNARMFGSIRSVASSALAALEAIQFQRAAPLAVRHWVREGHGVLFVPYRAGQIAALRSLIATWLRLAIFAAMDAPEGLDQRLWFIVDELDALGAIDGLKDALARLRKFGGRCVLGLQSIAQVSGTYGNAEAQTIVENCGNTLILRSAGSEHGGTSQFGSRLIGEREVLRSQRSRAHDRADWLSGARARRSHQVSEQSVVEPAVMAAELEQLPDLCGYLKTASAPHWQRVRLRPGRGRSGGSRTSRA